MASPDMNAPEHEYKVRVTISFVMEVLDSDPNAAEGIVKHYAETLPQSNGPELMNWMGWDETRELWDCYDTPRQFNVECIKVV